MVQINNLFFHLHIKKSKMTTTTEIPSRAIKAGLNYNAFRTMVTKLLAEGKVTGLEQKPSYLEYTKLNDHRMNRWDKHFQPSVQMLRTVADIDQPRIWLMITEGWCGDSAQILPAVANIAAHNKLIDLRVILRDENDEIMQKFLTNGTRSVPILVCLDQNFRVLWHWGPRPKGALELIARAKQEGTESSVWKEALHLWYARNKQEDLQAELIELIRSESL